ncbi:TRM11 family methyltransferase [Evansella sp. AB-rgal1]|uniref:TRM11 family SAM-dependent methyltransferase n=1 Tax=Evansella sp. AB-rgal1 TaxID=3242696 RepID=UPI00359E7C89
MKSKFIYTFSYTEEEKDLCQLEMRSFFQNHSSNSVLESTIGVHPNRSPFMKERIEVLLEGGNLQEVLSQLAVFSIIGTFKVKFVVVNESKISTANQKEIEREVGLSLNGNADLTNPDQFYGILVWKDRWYFGKYVKSESIWFQHQKKPRNYSTALNTRVARAVVNIAVPDGKNVTVIDPCCGIGTVLVEALSMSINIVGSDINPLAVIGARENVTHFGYSTEVTIKDLREVTGQYDIAIVDMPYNLCSVISDSEKQEMMQSVRQFAKKVVVITLEPMDSLCKQGGLEIKDRCVVKKGKMFSREILVME